MSAILKRYQQLSRLPAGNYLFSKAVGFSAPFFAKIHPYVVDLREGYCEVRMRDRRSVRNHLGTINAGALCSLAEMTGGMALDSMVPSNMRWIPRGMTVAYLAKATGTIRGITELQPDAIQPGDIVVPVKVYDEENTLVFTADITFYVSLKK